MLKFQFIMNFFSRLCAVAHKRLSFNSTQWVLGWGLGTLSNCFQVIKNFVLLERKQKVHYVIALIMDGLIFHSDRNIFNCGVDALNNYLKVMASQQANKDNSRTFVLEDENDNSLIIVFIH
jgi:hypothetical protein